ncbi:PAS domain-containing protein [Enterovirga sp. CN4-39]|uniref:PAS domain-containing protein n=1 Tax=Enterovirga sp. CN4-39 TaxID=3400910 RepID=UPI003BFB614F
MDFAQRSAEAILSGTADAVVATDRDGIIRLWNPGAERIFGHAAAEVIGASLDVIIPERLRARHWAGFRHTVATGESRYGAGDLLSVPSMRRDGTPISVEFTIVPIKDLSGRMEGMVAVMRDVTARFEETRRLRRAAAEAAAK